MPVLILRYFVLAMNNEIPKLSTELGRVDEVLFGELGPNPPQSTIKAITAFAERVGQATHVLNPNELGEVFGPFLQQTTSSLPKFTLRV